MIGWCFYFWLRQSCFHWIIDNGVVNRIGRNGNVLILLTPIWTFCQAYDADYYSNFWFSQGCKLSYDSDYNPVTSENQPLHTYANAAISLAELPSKFPCFSKVSKQHFETSLDNSNVKKTKWRSITKLFSPLKTQNMLDDAYNACKVTEYLFWYSDLLS